MTHDESSYLRYLRKDGVVAIGQTNSEIEVLSASPPSLLGGLYQFRDFVSVRINSLFPEPTSGLMNGLLLGLRVQLGDDLKANLKNSGTTHIIALSGFNITIIAGFFLFLARPLKKNWALVLAAFGILLFVLMTGASSSVVRAAIMGWILLMTKWWGRRIHSMNAVLVAGAIMVLLNPYILQYDIGFQLSLVATIGIIALVPVFSPYLKVLPTVFGEITATTISATLLTLPLVAFHFGGFSSVSLFSNLLILPLIPIVMLVGFLSLLLAIIIPLPVINIVGVAGAKIIVWLINWFGSLNVAFIGTPNVSVWIPLIYYLSLLLIYWWWNDKKRRQV
jgi:competence protein ComEC